MLIALVVTWLVTKAKSSEEEGDVRIYLQNALRSFQIGKGGNDIIEHNVPI